MNMACTTEHIMDLKSKLEVLSNVMKDLASSAPSALKIMNMACTTEHIMDLKSKLEVLSNVMKDLASSAPSALKIFLKDYQEFFTNEPWITKSVPAQINASCQTDSPIDQNAWNLANISGDVTDVAGKVTEQTGLSYDHISGWYYDHKMKCYYDPNSRLYYYSEHRSYYYYDEESKTLKYYCSLDSQTELKDPNSNDTQAIIEEVNRSQENEQDIEKEDGECSDTSPEETSIDSPKPVVIEAAPLIFQPKNTKHFAPCIRVVVKTSELPNLSIGSLFIITCIGGTIGREGEHDILIPDDLVSKLHAEFRYVCRGDNHFYEITDLGSKNGTLLNGKRLSCALVKSEPAPVTHDCIITVGRTDLLCHIHPYDDTCPDCAPCSITKGTKRSYFKAFTLKEKYHLEADSIRQKFGIKHHAINKIPIGYEDRARVRRNEVGSSHHSEKTETASINQPIGVKNKGFTLLSKMGWKKGETLGMKKKGGTLEPIIPTEQQKHSGLGWYMPRSSPKHSKKIDLASKTLQRYKQGKTSEDDNNKC